ncbi:MAG TPA: hypothetical protein VGK73_18550 [Polyangiaceae bacterium]
MDPDQGSPSLKAFRPRRKVGRIVVGVLLALAAALVGSLFMPVCVRIPDEQVPAFESVSPLSERAARGEPFEKKGKHWYQCKSRLARMFFF